MGPLLAHGELLLVPKQVEDLLPVLEQHTPHEKKIFFFKGVISALYKDEMTEVVRKNGPPLIAKTS